MPPHDSINYNVLWICFSIYPSSIICISPLKQFILSPKFKSHYDIVFKVLISLSKSDLNVDQIHQIQFTQYISGSADPLDPEICQITHIICFPNICLKVKQDWITTIDNFHFKKRGRKINKMDKSLATLTKKKRGLK